VGVDGGLFWVDFKKATGAWVYRHAGNSSSGETGLYTYIKTIWIDPNDSNHLLFGGAAQTIKTLELYETFDGGKTLSFPVLPTGFVERPARIFSGIPFGSENKGFIFVATYKENEKAITHIFLKDHSSN
jgi:hypothetical protein